MPPFPPPGNHANNTAQNINTTTNAAATTAANTNGPHPLNPGAANGNGPTGAQTFDLGNGIVLGMGPMPPGGVPIGAMPALPPPPNGTVGNEVPPALLQLFANSLGMGAPPPQPPPVPDDMD